MVKIMNVDDIKNKAGATVIGKSVGYYGEVTELIPNPYVMLKSDVEQEPKPIWMAKSYILVDGTKYLEVLIIESDRAYRIMENKND